MYFQIRSLAGRFARRSIRPTPVRDLVDVFLSFFKGIRDGNKMTVHVEPKLNYNEKKSPIYVHCGVETCYRANRLYRAKRHRENQLSGESTTIRVQARCPLKQKSHYTWFSHQSHVRG